MLDFSIIIPVYNAEKTLERCLDSINAQTFSNYEILLIDDGSSDNSLNICKKYQLADKRYQVVHQANSGPSSARNAGLDIAQGSWICFVDSDDSIEPNYLQEIINVTQVKEVDVVFLGHHKVFGNAKREVHIPDITEGDKNKMLIELSEKDMFGYTWIKCFRKNIIDGMRFDLSLDLFEDEVFTCQVLQNCERVGIVNSPIYNYYIGDGSTLIGRTHEDYCLKCDRVYDAWKEMLGTDSDKQVILEQKANGFVSRCYYYGFERQVDIKKFFGYLGDMSFFREHTMLNSLDEYVKASNFKKLYLAKLKYQIKIFVSSRVHEHL